MAKEKVAKSSEFYTVCSTPDLCKVQAGTAVVVVPFMVKGEFKEAENVSPNVFARGCPVVWKSESTIPHVRGDAGGNLFGVKSGTKEDEAKAVRGLSSVKVNGHEIVRVGDVCTLNRGNTFGRIFYRGGPAPTLPGAKPKPPAYSSPQGQANAVLRQVAAGSVSSFNPMPPGTFEKQPGDKPEGPDAKDEGTHKAQHAMGAVGAMAGALSGGEQRPDVVQMPPPEEPRKGGPPESTVHGTPHPGRCELKPYRNEDGSRNCPENQTAHHVIPDRVYRIGSRKKGERIPGAPSAKEGLCICVDGRNLDPNLEHGRIHGFYDRRERVLGRIGKPKGTAKMGTVEKLAARSTARQTGCDEGYLQHQLSEFNKKRGIQPNDRVRSDPGGRWTKGMDAKSLGKGSGTRTGWTDL